MFVEEHILVHYSKHEGVDDEWLIVSIPADRAEYSKEIIEVVKKILEVPPTCEEDDEGYGDYLTIMDNRIAVLKGITGCKFRFEENDNTVINVSF